MPQAAVQGVTSEGVIREVWVAARPETIFPFFTDAEKIVQWMGIAAEIDPRPGGVFRCQCTPRNTARGEMVSVDPCRRIVFTWGWEGPDAVVKPGASTVEVTFQEENEGTRVRLHHYGLSGDAAERHDHGWRHFIARLEVVCNGGDPGPDPWAAAA